MRAARAHMTMNGEEDGQCTANTRQIAREGERKHFHPSLLCRELIEGSLHDHACTV